MTEVPKEVQDAYDVLMMELRGLDTDVNALSATIRDLLEQHKRVKAE